jgi:hypothetical protein
VWFLIFGGSTPLPTIFKRGLSVRILALRTLTAVVGCLGIAWGLSNMGPGEAADDFRDIETRLLQFEGFSQATEERVLASAAQDTSGCDSHAQHALLLIEIPLVDAALRSGALDPFNQRTRSLEARARDALSCTPRDSFVWLVLFGLQTAHGVLDEHTFALLAMSYQTAPNEAWIAVRRVLLAVPVVRSAPGPMQETILTEFQTLIANGFFDMPARAYQNASEAVRRDLQARVEQLDTRSQKYFAEALQKLRS